jgi:hypothetical protein
MNRMTFACLAGLAFAGGLGAWYAVSWYKGRGLRRERKRVRKVAEEKEYNEAIAKQIA